MQGWPVFKERVGEGFGGAPVSASIPTTCWSAQMHACDTVTNGGKLALGPGWDIEAGGLAAVPSSRHSPDVWREEDFSIDRLGLRFADGVWAEEGEKRCRLPAHCAWQRTAEPQEANFEDPWILSSLDSPCAYSPRLPSALGVFTHGDSLLKAEAPGVLTGVPVHGVIRNPQVPCGATTMNVGNWDLMLGEELPSSLLGNRSNTLASLATQGVEVQEDASLFMGDDHGVGDCKPWGSVYVSDNSRLVLPSAGTFLSGASLAGGGHQAMVGNMQLQLQENVDDIGGCDRAKGECAVGIGICGVTIDPRTGEELIFPGLSCFDNQEEDEFLGLTGSGQVGPTVVAENLCGFKLSGQGVSERYPDIGVVSTPEQWGKDCCVIAAEQQTPQFPSLTSVFGSCNGSSGAVHAACSSEWPQLPSLNSVFGTCGSHSCVSNMRPHLPSLTSVFGSCHGRTEEQQQACQVDCRGEHALKKCSIALSVFSELGESPVAGESILANTSVGCAPGSLGVGGPRGAQGSRGSNCLLLKEGAHDDPFFDAEWNLIPMLNELWGEEAQSSGPKRSGGIQAKIFFERLKDVPLVPQQHVLTIRNLGEGSYGRVSLGFCPGLGEIAVKWNKASERPGNGFEFQHEAAVLATLQHPNILGLHGLVTRSASEGEVVGFMTEYAPYGTLSEYIRHTRRVLPLRKRAFLALQVAKGMAFIHSRDIVHFDLKPDNVLVQHSDNAFPLLKVADLGLARRKIDGVVRAPGSLRGTLPYMAPELVCDVPFVSEKVDVWAFGCMLHEMVSLEVPYSDMASDEIVMGLMEGWLQPATPVCEPEWEELLQGCLVFAPQCRTSFEELCCRLACLYDACQQDDIQQ